MSLNDQISYDQNSVFGNKLGLIVSIEGSVNTDKYTSLLHNNFLPYLDALIADGITGSGRRLCNENTI